MSHFEIVFGFAVSKLEVNYLDLLLQVIGINLVSFFMLKMVIFGFLYLLKNDVKILCKDFFYL